MECHTFCLFPTKFTIIESEWAVFASTHTQNPEIFTWHTKKRRRKINIVEMNPRERYCNNVLVTTMQCAPCTHWHTLFCFRDISGSALLLQAKKFLWACTFFVLYIDEFILKFPIQKPNFVRQSRIIFVLKPGTRAVCGTISISSLAYNHVVEQKLAHIMESQFCKCIQENFGVWSYNM